MNIVGIIAEYNPFHRGHEYQILKLKELCQADYVIIAMSGNFVQRGIPALMDKYSRTLMALSCGADLVLELPALFATASAEYFAGGGVSLLNSTGIVTHLGFGVETDNRRLLSELAAILSKEPEPYREFLRKELKSGSSFPVARSAALRHFISDAAFAHFQPQADSTKCAKPQLHISSLHEIEETLALPNNILALEYLRALADSHSSIVPVPILRKGKGYHDPGFGKAGTDPEYSFPAVRQESHPPITEHDFCSASAIRSCLKNGSSPVPETAMPKASYHILRNYPHPFLFEDDFSALLHYELLTDDTGRLAAWADSSPELARRLTAEREFFTDWSNFCQHIKTKNITYARLSRLFTHMLLHIRQEDCQTLAAPSYLRILGFRETAAPLLTALKSGSSLPLITSPSDAGHLLSPDAKKLLGFDLRATDLYRLCLTSKGDCTLKNDYKQQIVRL